MVAEAVVLLVLDVPASGDVGEDEEHALAWAFSSSDHRAAPPLPPDAFDVGIGVRCADRIFLISTVEPVLIWERSFRSRNSITIPPSWTLLLFFLHSNRKLIEQGGALRTRRTAVDDKETTDLVLLQLLFLKEESLANDALLLVISLLDLLLFWKTPDVESTEDDEERPRTTYAAVVDTDPLLLSATTGTDGNKTASLLPDATAVSAAP